MIEYTSSLTEAVKMASDKYFVIKYTIFECDEIIRGYIVCDSLTVNRIPKKEVEYNIRYIFYDRIISPQIKEEIKLKIN